MSSGHMARERAGAGEERVRRVRECVGDREAGLERCVGGGRRHLAGRPVRSDEARSVYRVCDCVYRHAIWRVSARGRARSG